MSLAQRLGQSSPRAECEDGLPGRLTNPQACPGLWPPPGFPTSQEIRLSLSFHPWRDADVVSSPGLTFSGQSPEDHDLSMADMSEEEQFFEILAREALKVGSWLPAHLPQHPPPPPRGLSAIVSSLGVPGRAAPLCWREGRQGRGLKMLVLCISLPGWGPCWAGWTLPSRVLQGLTREQKRGRCWSG